MPTTLEIRFSHAYRATCHRVILINHDFGVDKFLPIIKAARVGFPGLWLSVNFLAVSGKEAFPKLARLQNEDCHVGA